LPLAGIQVSNSELTDDLLLFKQMKEAAMKAVEQDPVREDDII
jgi:hypothetical protein